MIICTVNHHCMCCTAPQHGAALTTARVTDSQNYGMFCTAPLQVLHCTTSRVTLPHCMPLQVDVLVSNAGRSQRARWDAIDLAVDRDIFELNVFSLVALARLVNRHFSKVGAASLKSVMHYSWSHIQNSSLIWNL